MDVENIIIEPWPNLALSIRIMHPTEDISYKEFQTLFSDIISKHTLFEYDGHFQLVCYDGDRHIMLPALRMSQNEYGI